MIKGGSEAAMPLRQIGTGDRQKVKITLDFLGYFRAGQDVGPGRGQFDSQRQPIDQLTNASDGWLVG